MAGNRYRTLLCIAVPRVWHPSGTILGWHSISNPLQLSWMVLLISKRKLKSKPQVLQRAAVIHDEQSRLHFDVQTELYLFAPKVGSILQGTVNHIQNTTHVGCLVYGCFNATVLRRSKGNSKRKNGMERGQSIRFKVVKLKKVSGVLCIFGQEEKQER